MHAGIVLSDRLANGAGFVRWASGNINTVFSEIATPVPGSYIANIFKEEHLNDCDSACYECLKVYRNMTYHGLLDWRLGISYLKTLLNPNYLAGLDGNFNSRELDGWLENATLQRDRFAGEFGFTPRNFGELPGFEAGSVPVILIHPLWDIRDPQRILAMATAEATISSPMVSFLDTFNISRRPGECYRALLQIAG